MEPGQPSRTAVFVCQGRAVADGCAGVEPFADPVAERLLSEAELEPVRLARRGELPDDGRARLVVQSVSACAAVMAPRTVLIDAAVSRTLGQSGNWQVVLLGAGLDGRPWRLAALRGITVFSLDHPASQADLRRRAETLPSPVCDLRFVAVDLTHEPLGPRLAAAGHDPLRPTVWIWEGVIPYLSRPQVTATLDALTRISAAGSVLVAQYQSRSLSAQVGRRVAGLVSRLSGAVSPLAGEPWRSLWSERQISRLLADRGWVVDSDVSLLESTTRCDTPHASAGSLANGRVAVARLGARSS